MNPNSTRLSPWLGLLLLWASGFTLRITVLSVPPLSIEMTQAFGLSVAGTGALTMLPLVAIGLGALPVAWLVARFGVKQTIVVGLLMMGVAASLRGFALTTQGLFAWSVVMGLAIAAVQTALPSAVQIWSPAQLARGAAVYLNGMMVGELAGAGFTIPLVLPWVGGDWRYALVFWGGVSVLVMLAVGWLSPATTPSASTSRSGAVPQINDWQAWRFGVLLGSSIVSFYILNSYAAAILKGRGEMELLPVFLFLFNAMPLPGSLLVLAKPSWIARKTPVFASGIACAVGLLGFFFGSGWWAMAFAMLTGFAATVQLILLMSIPSVIATGHQVGRLAAGMTCVGYGLAFLIPYLGGVMAESFSDNDYALVPAIVLAGGSLVLVGRRLRAPYA